MSLDQLPMTGEVARRLTQELGVPISECLVNGILRRTPAIAPPIKNRRRRWRPEDVAALRQRLARTRAPEHRRISDVEATINAEVNKAGQE